MCRTAVPFLTGMRSLLVFSLLSYTVAWMYTNSETVIFPLASLSLELDLKFPYRISEHTPITAFLSTASPLCERQRG